MSNVLDDLKKKLNTAQGPIRSDWSNKRGLFINAVNLLSGYIEDDQRALKH